ncbi:hypothetical protein HHI36_024265 [Cryptolaemus montrouzieri]|uniref:Uncharacterized protein n=1 Tax=Cryptolaemus montrouzieri TaxID=559131 RepID=A0ABD2P3Y9_9CUCU
MKETEVREKDLLKWTKVIIGNPIEDKEATTKVIIVKPDDSFLQNRIQRLFINKCHELNKLNGNFEVMKQITTRRTDGQVSKERTSTKIIKVIHNDCDEDISKQLSKVKEETKADNIIAIHYINIISVDRLRKMIEYIFQKKNTKVRMYIADFKTREDQSKTSIGIERRTNAFIVQGTNKTFNELLASTKEKIDGTELSTAIKSQRGTKDDKKDVDEKFIDLIDNKECMEKKKAGFNTKMKTLILRIMNALSTKEEVVEALKKTNKIKEETKYRLSRIRLATNNTKTITLAIEEAVAEELLKSKNIRIVKGCKGPDRSKMCRKYGMEEHQATECTNEEYCPLCEKGGHKAGRGKSKHFKTALEKGRRIQAKYFPLIWEMKKTQPQKNDSGCRVWG